MEIDAKPITVHGVRAPSMMTQAAFVAAITWPLLMAYSRVPSATLFNQLAALAGWGLAVGAVTLAARTSAALNPRSTTVLNDAWPLLGACLILASAALGSSALGSLPWGLGLSNLGFLLATLVVVFVGAWSASNASILRAFLTAWVLTGVLSSIVAMVQIFAPEWADGFWVARSSLIGRAVGNVRQPNHLATLMLCACAALVPWTLGLRGLSRARRHLLAAVLMALFVWTITVTASRTGTVGVLLLAIWGGLDRRLDTRWRLVLLLTPLVYLLSWWGMAAWAEQAHKTFGATARLAESDLSNSRLAIWRDTLALIAAEPWAGVGFGEFNLAWSMTPSPERPVAFFDHSHNLVLQMLAELGVPVGGLVVVLLLAALVAAVRRTWGAAAGHPRSIAAGNTANSSDALTPEALLTATRRALAVSVVMMGVHSLLEYPLWYAHLLLPTAFAWGACLRRLTPSTEEVGGFNHASAALVARTNGVAPTVSFIVAGALMTLSACWAAVDFARVAIIFETGTSLPPLSERVERGRRSTFFAHHADYAWATVAATPGEAIQSFKRSTHFLLDARLMQLWSQALAESGDVDAARHVAARLREFRNEGSQGFFAVCAPAASTQELAFQCTPPRHSWTWRELLSTMR